MPLRLRCFVLAALIAAAVGCGPREPEPVDPSAQDPLWASFIVAHPHGLVSKKAQVYVRFAEDVVDDEAVGRDASSVLSIEPRVPGDVRFTSRREVRLVPAEALRSGQRYRVRLRRRGLSGLPDRLVRYDFDFRVIEQELEVEVHGLSASAAADGSMVLTGVIRTADVEDADDIEQMLETLYRGRELPILWRHSGDEKAHEFEVTELDRGDAPETFHLRWDAAPIGLDERGERNIEVPPTGLFEVTQVRTVREAEPYVQVFFSDALDRRQDLKGLVLLGSREPKLRVEENVLKIYPEPGFEGTLDLVVDAAVRSENGARLAETYRRRVVFESEKPGVRFAGTGVILPDNPVLSVPFEAIGVHAVRVTAFRIFENNVAQFLQTNTLDGGIELSRVGRYLFRKTIPLSAPEPDRWNRFGLDVTELFEGKPGGLYRLRLSITRADANVNCPGAPSPVAAEAPLANHEDLWVQEVSNWDDAEAYYGQGGDGSTWRDRHDPCKDAYYRYGEGVKDERNFLASNLGLLAKRDQEGGLLAVATDLRTAEPLGGVALTVFNFQNQPIAKAHTDTRGMARVDLEETPFYMLAEKGADQGYLKLSKGTALPVSHLDVGGERVHHGLKGVLYGERGVWRPGDTLHLTFVYEDASGRLPPDHPVSLELVNPRGQLVDQRTNAAPVGRFYPFAVATDEDAPTGIWTARARLGGASFTKRIRIETVMPNRLDVDLDFGREALRRTDMPLAATLRGRWLTGAAASGLDADVKLTLRSVPTRFDRNADFVFDDPARTFTGEPQTLFEGRLDGEGTARFRTNVELEREAPGMLRASFTSRIFEKGGAFSVSRTSLPFAPYERYVGIKLPKGDRSRNMLLTDVDHTVEIATLDADGNPVPVEDVLVNLYKIHWRWWWDKSGDSLAQYASATHTGVVAQDHVATRDGRGTWQFRIDYPEWGRYLLRACDTRGGHCTGQVFYIDWPGWAGRAREQAGPGANTLSFVSDKPRYEVGETAKIQLPEATEGRALVSIESGTGILEARWIQLDAETAKAPLEIPITDAMSPNVYVSITLVQPHAGKKNDRPIRLYGSIPILVEDPASRLDPVIDAPEEWTPGSRASVAVSEARGRPMTYTLAVVDEGLLGLTHFRTPDLHAHFYRREALGVTTWDLFDHVVGAYGGELERLLALGGGADADIEPESDRKRFPPVVVFLGPFELEAGGRNEHRFELPPYVGAVRVMVVAGGEDAYGSKATSVFVRKPLMLLPTLPRVIGPTEEMTVPVATFVTDPSIHDVELRVEAAAGFDVVGPDTQKLSFDAPGDQLGRFRLRAGRRLGKKTIRITATSGAHRDVSEVTLETRAPNPPTTRTLRKTLAPGESWTAEIEPHGLPGTNRASLEVSSVPAMDLERRLDGLIRYPHGCLEQTTSAVFPQLYLARLVKLAPARQKAVEAHVQAGIDKLRRFQAPTGGFLYWPGGFWSATIQNHWATSYAGHFLVEAERLGYAVPPQVLADWTNHQSSVAHAWSGGSEPAVLDQAYRLYTLALAGAPEIGAMNRLRQSDALPLIARWQLAAAYKLAGLPDAADDLVRGQPTDVRHDEGPDPTFGSALRDRAIVLQSLVTLDRREEAEPLVEHIARELSSDRWHSTQSVAHALMALARYSGGDAPGPARFTLRVAGGRREVDMEAPIHTETLDTLPETGQTLSLTNDGDRTLYASVTVVGTPEPGNERSSRDGLRLTVRYRDLDGTPLDVSRLSQGTDIVAEIEVRNTTGASLQNLALTQILPSGWEILNARLDEPLEGTEPAPAGRRSADYEDVRDDRIYRYFDSKPGTTRRFVTLLHAAYAGRYYLPSVSVEAMYDARKHARTTGQWVDVVP